MTAQFTTLLGVVGALAFLVSVITQVLKNLGPLERVPTTLLVFGLSIVLTMVAFFAYSSYAAIAIVWYQVVGALVGSFIVAFIAMFGWEKLKELWEKFKEAS